MKCVENLETGKVFRVEDEVARRIVDGHVYIYVPKSRWKEKRDDS